MVLLELKDFFKHPSSTVGHYFTGILIKYLSLFYWKSKGFHCFMVSSLSLISIVVLEDQDDCVVRMVKEGLLSS